MVTRPTNSIRENLESGQVSIGATMAISNPDLIEMLGNLGLDFVYVGFESYGPAPSDSLNVLGHYARAAAVSGTELIVKLPSNEPHMVRRALDAGLRNILIPRIETADEIRKAVEAGRFDYDGEMGQRGVAPTRANDWGNYPEDHFAVEDSTTLIGVMIENITAVENLDSILQVPEIGFARLGTSDLAVSLGVQPRVDHPALDEPTARFEQKCKEYGVPLNGPTSSAAEAVDAIERGYELVTIGTDLYAIRSVIGDRLADVRDRL